MGGGYLGLNGWEGKKKRGLRENIKQEQEAKTVGLLYGFGRERFYICVHISSNISLSTIKIARKKIMFFPTNSNLIFTHQPPVLTLSWVLLRRR